MSAALHSSDSLQSWWWSRGARQNVAMWPHAPTHHLSEAGAFIVTAATYGHAPVFRHREGFVHDTLLRIALDLDWRLEAWAVFANHYHFVAQSPSEAQTLLMLLRRLHASTATAVTRADGTPGRRVWGNYWETPITNQRSYLARLAYVHQNPVEHGVAAVAGSYPWGSASWFESAAPPAHVATVYSFKIDRVKVFDVECRA